MPLKCLRDGQEVFAFNFSNDMEWKQLRVENAEKNYLRMCCCPSTVVLKTSRLGTRYFAHSRRGECTTAPETAEHLLAKNTIAEGIRRATWTAKVEQEGRTPTGEVWVADVMATRQGKKSAAFEVQWSRQAETETRERQARYEAAGIRSMWFMRQHDFPVEKEVPAFRLRFDETSKTFHVMLPSPYYNSEWISSRDKDEPRYLQQSIELSRFVEGSLTGRLHFAAAVNKILPLEVEAAVTSCWRCHRQTSIITGLTFAAGKVMQNCPDIHVSIYAFDEIEPEGHRILMEILSADLLKRHGIGVVKPRYSKTERKAYLSNGCVHCDALQGRHFDHEVAWEGKTAFSINVMFDQKWASQLRGSRSYIYRWWFKEGSS